MKYLIEYYVLSEIGNETITYNRLLIRLSEFASPPEINRTINNMVRRKLLVKSYGYMASDYGKSELKKHIDILISRI